MLHYLSYCPTPVNTLFVLKYKFIFGQRDVAAVAMAGTDILASQCAVCHMPYDQITGHLHSMLQKNRGCSASPLSVMQSSVTVPSGTI